MSETIVIKFSFSGKNIETGQNLKDHKETHYVPQDDFSLQKFLERIEKVYFPDDLWQQKQIKLLFVTPCANL